MAYPSNVGCDFVVPTNKDTPLYLSTPYTRNELNSEHKGIELFHEQIERSHDRLESDLIGLINRLGFDSEKLEEIFYTENPFINRDWEWITFSPNRLTRIEFLLTQLEVRVLELMGQFKDTPSLIPEQLEAARKKLEELVESNFNID